MFNCSLNCKTCSDSAYHCLSCKDGYYLNDNFTCEEIANIIIINSSNDIIINSAVCEVKEFFLGKCKNNFKNQEDKEKFKNNIVSAIKDGSLNDLIASKVKNDIHIIINDSN